MAVTWRDQIGEWGYSVSANPVSYTHLDVYKRQGKRITTYTVETINELEPTRFPEPEQEPQEERCV